MVHIIAENREEIIRRCKAKVAYHKRRDQQERDPARPRPFGDQTCHHGVAAP